MIQHLVSFQGVPERAHEFGGRSLGPGTCTLMDHAPGRRRPRNGSIFTGTMGPGHTRNALQATVGPGVAF